MDSYLNSLQMQQHRWQKVLLIQSKLANDDNKSSVGVGMFCTSLQTKGPVDIRLAYLTYDRSIHPSIDETISLEVQCGLHSGQASIQPYLTMHSYRRVTESKKSRQNTNVRLTAVYQRGECITCRSFLSLRVASQSCNEHEQ